MKLLMQEICQFAKCTPSSRNYIEGERVLNSGHVIYCGKEHDESVVYKVIGYCLQTSSMRDNPHEINGKININGSTETMQCSCKAGLSEACKHIVGVLLYLSRLEIFVIRYFKQKIGKCKLLPDFKCNILLYRNDLSTLEIVSCTDRKCLWQIRHKTALEVYNPVTLKDHACLKEDFLQLKLLDLQTILLKR